MARTTATLPLIVLALCAASAHAAEPLVAELVGERLFETERADVAVSGSVVVGVATRRAGGGRALAKLQLSPRPLPDDGQVCLTVLSRDGVYYSRNSFRLPPDSEGATVRLPYATTRAARLADYGSEDLAVLITAGSCEQGDDRAYLLADAAAPQPPTTIRLLINSFGATDVFFRTGSPVTEGSCTAITTGRRTSFDHWCDIPWPQGSERRELVIERERYGRAMPVVRLALPLFAGD
ncbi:hypothetical protein [Thauera phenolivorans]|uniref:hypothetical protein n=2 Tax=Thauera phenolivorans TaxID=1792543 RepID=UPI00083B8DD9|nr:hypothetical protein [Thauera phenolivorans]